MFLTFESSQPSKSPDVRSPKKQTTRRSERINNRRRSTPRACASCRQRKIRCDGGKPCEACQWYKKADTCVYPDRNHWARESQSETSSSPNYREALKRLFPYASPEELVHMSREKLLAQITKPADPFQQSESSHQHQQHVESLTVDTVTSAETHGSALSLERPTGLEALHSIPVPAEDDDHGVSQSEEESDEQLSDDVNALSLPSRNLTSYLGVSSIQAALKVIAWLHPELHTQLSQISTKEHRPRREPVNPSLFRSERELLEAYFTNFQPFSPLLDEETVRSTFLSGHRKDDRWLALLNAILALGSITSAGVDNHVHRTHFERSMSRLNFRTLGNPSLEVVQTLGLLGGWYCHYDSKPNLAYALMGASLRMAVTLGLQREALSTGNNHMAMNPVRTGYDEFKRRIWWSLCCLETWGHETLGRPSLDFFGPSITVATPRILDNEDYVQVLPLIENVQFVRIASKIQESLAALPSLTHTEMNNLDRELIQWYNNLPPVLRDYSPCPESLRAVRTVMRWRFYSQRMLLYRPSLLSYAMRRIPLIALREEERAAVQRCRQIAEEALEDISTTTTTTEMNQMIGWNGVWLAFQNTMVPLISLSACSARTPSDGGADSDGDAAATASANESMDEFEAYKLQIQNAMATLDRLRPYGHTAERSLKVIKSIYETIINTPSLHSSTNASLPIGDENDNLEMNNHSINTSNHNNPTHNNNNNNNIGHQVYPLATNYQPIARERALDWSGASSAVNSAAPFENFSAQHMWEYLSWGGNNDLWPEVYQDFNSQPDEPTFFGPS